MPCEMSESELLALPVSVDLATAGRAFGLGRTKAFELAKRDEFPCRVLRVGSTANAKYRVPRSAIFQALGVEDTARCSACVGGGGPGGGEARARE